MSEGKTMRLNKVLRELNISLDRAVEYLAKKGHEIDSRPTTKISSDIYQVLQD
ncbi:MAG: translation initiation factor IF-2, partial [Polaribacter sp.]